MAKDIYLKTLKLPGCEDVFHPLPLIQDSITDEGKILQITNNEWQATFPDYVVSDTALDAVALSDELYQRIINVKGLLKGIGAGGITQAIADTDYISPTGGKMSGALVAQANNNSTVRQMRNIVFSTTEPTSSDGDNGDVWIVYTL